MSLNETNETAALDQQAQPATFTAAPQLGLAQSQSSNANTNSMNIYSDDNNMLKGSHEDWANSLVGRWFEVYWDPDGETDEANEQTKQDEVASTPPQPAATAEEQQQPLVESAPQSQELKPQIQKNNVLYTGSRMGLSLQQIHIPTTAAVDPSTLNIINQHRLLQNVTAPLPYVVIKTVLPDAANGHLLRVNDIITGINGNSFYNPEFQAGGGGDFFNRVVGQLRDAKRPMVVNFERVVLPEDKAEGAAASDASAGMPLNTNLPPNYRKPSDKDLAYPAEPVEDLPYGWTLRRIPRASSNHKTCDVYYYSPREQFKFRSRPEVSRFLDYLQQTGGDEIAAIGLFRDQATLKGQTPDIDDVPLDVLKQSKKRLHESDSDEEEEEEECDAVDWYDAKILSYSNGEFVIYFLGDEDGVTYTMPLTREAVRPSVRAWATRTRALLDCNLDFAKVDDIEGWTAAFKSSLPPTTDLLGDLDDFTRGYNGETKKTTVGHEKICVYKQMIALQLHLAKLISPANDEIEEEEEDTNGPGPFTNAFEVKALCRYLSEAQDACDWLLSEDIAWTLMKLLTEPTEGLTEPTKLSEQILRSFLINGARVLHRLLRADPASAKKTSGRKKQRLGAIEGTAIDGSFNLMLQSASISDKSMDAVVAHLSSHYSEMSKPKCIDSTMHDIVDQTYSALWRPISSWIKTAEDIVGEQSEKRYNISAIEQHMSDAESIRALRFVDISSMTMKLGAMLSRLQQFEMEVWSAIKACIQLNVSREAITSTESVNVVGSNDACYAALQRLKHEASMHPIKNVNPLGKAVMTSDGPVASPLTRTVIDDAITIRLWILDLMQAKLLRERSSFIEVSRVLLAGYCTDLYLHFF